MSLVKSKNNTSNKLNSRGLARIIVMLLVCFVSVLTFTACKWTNDNDTESSFDAAGNLRITSPYITFNPYSNYGDDDKLVDDLSGSFTWELAYFINDGTKDANFDQSYYLNNFYFSQDYSEENIFNYYDASGGIKPKYFENSESAVEYYKSLLGINTLSVEGSGKGFYAYDNSGSYSRVLRVYTPADKAISNTSTISFPDYEVVVDGKYYTFRVTLNQSYLTKNVTDFNPFGDSSYDYEKREFKEVDADGNEIKSLFTFSYRVGKASTQDSTGFLPCPEGFMTYFIDEDNRFMIRFNPRLEEGSTNRYIKVRALTDTANGRTNSLYSNTVAFEAYTMTFSSYSPNSSSLDYGSLYYDESAYYFHTVKKIYNNKTGNNDISSVVGVFPEGRRVVITRESLFADDYDYALQPWTINTKAENSQANSMTFPSVTIEDKKVTMLSPSLTTDNKYYSGLLSTNASDCIPDAMATGSDAFAAVTMNATLNNCSKCLATGKVDEAPCETCGGTGHIIPDVKTYKYYTKSEVNDLTNLNTYINDTFYSIYDANANKIATRSVLSVVSHYKVNNYKFYANFAKVRNFTLSGTFFAGDNFFTNGNQYLTDVMVSVFDANGKRICISSVNEIIAASQLNVNEDTDGDGLPNEDGSPVSTIYRTNGITFSFDGAHFEVKGLEVGDYLYFEKLGRPLLDDGTFDAAANLPYGFHSTQMVRLDIESLGVNTKVLMVKESDVLYADKQDIGVIGTQYAEESNLTVNLYQVDDGTGEATQVEGGLRLLSEGNVAYEIIKSVSSYEDKYGYITTNVIISILLPSNATLVSYNAETINDTQAVYYSIGSETNTPTYILKRTYDVETQSYTMDFYEDLYTFSVLNNINPSDIAEVSTGTFITYNGDTYTYSHNTTREDAGQISTTSYYNKLNESSSDRYTVMAKTVVGENTTWSIINYSKVDESVISGTVVEEGQIKIPVITVNGNRIYQYTGTDNDIASNEANEVSTVVSVYKTDMIQATDDGTNDIYVYYDVKLANDKAYYTSPIAKNQYVESEEEGQEGAIIIDTAYYFSEITNFDELLANGTIMLGSDILAGRNGNGGYGREYREVLKAKIVQTCYYYVKPIGETVDGEDYQPITVLAKQYLQTIQSVGQQQVTTTYYYNDNGTLKVFNGTVSSATVKFYESTLYAYNLNGVNIDLESYTSIVDDTLYDSSGVLDYSIGTKNTIGPSNYQPSHTKVEVDASLEKAGYFFIENTYRTVDDLKIRFAYTLYLVNNDGTIKTTQLYRDDSGYFWEVVDTYQLSYTEVVDGVDTIITKTVSEIKENSNFKVTYRNTTGSLLDRFRITYINYDSSSYTDLSTYSIQTVNTVDGAKSYSICNAFIIPSYYVLNSDGKTETQIFHLVSDGNGNSTIPSRFTLNTIPYVEYKGIVDGTTYTLLPKTTTSAVSSPETALVRTAQKAKTNTQVTLLGKYTQTGDSNDPIIYPSFSNLNKWSLDEAVILQANAKNSYDMFDHYYAMDYTSEKIVIEGFPGVTLLAGSPYPNPVIYLSVRHKKTEDAIVNISFDIKNAYYVEIMGTQIQTEDSNLIRDFTTYAFKDTVTNLQLNDYIDKSYWILDRETLNPIIPYIYENGNYVPKLVDENGEAVELSIQDIGLNDDSVELFYSDTLTAAGKYKNKVYMQYTKENGEIGYKPINYETDVILWRTDATKVENVPMYDIHSYTQGKDGIIYFDSGTDTDDNILCIGLEGISSGATQTEDAMFNYDQVLVSGVTSAYRTKASELNISSEMFYGYWADLPLNVINAYNSNDAYFLTGKESVIVVASPTVHVTDDNNDSYIYRFKEWQVYSRYNSEVLYYNRGITETAVDRYNAIFRFSSKEAGYFVILPVYERVYKVDLGTAVIDGAINQGGDINVLYSGGSDVNVDEATLDELYLVEYLKTEFNNVEGYYYSNIIGAPFLWYTGENDLETGMEIFEIKTNIFAIRYNQTYKRFLTEYSTGDVILYFELIMENGVISGVKPVRVLNAMSVGYPGLVPITNINGNYTFAGVTKPDFYEGYRLKTGTTVNEWGYTVATSEPTRLIDLICHSFTADFFFDSILSESTSNKVTTIAYLDQETKLIHTVDTTKLDTAVESAISGRAGIFSKKVETLLEYILYWNMINNSHIFSNSNVFEKIGGKFEDNYLDDIDKEQLLFSSTITLKSLLSDPIARNVTNSFTSLNIFKDEILVDSNYYRSTHGSLDAGELAYDEEGNLYSTIQFKTVYLDRDTAVKLEASPDHGYRVEGWYMCIYDEEAGVWYTTDEKVQNSDNVYSDEILLAEYNETLKTYYYITEYYEERGVGKIYYFDEDKTEEAEVPSRMLDKVRGFFVNTGSEENPNYLQVYRKGNGDSTAYYYDTQFSRIVDLTKYEIVELSYYAAINRTNADQGLYTLNNISIYRKTDKDGNNEQFFRVMTTGNIVVDGNTLIINKLHSNVRYVAKFIEVYTENIFAEPSESSGIEVKAVYYTTSDNEKVERDGDYTVIRTDKEGHNLTGEYHVDYNAYGIDKEVSAIDQNFFNLYEQEDAAAKTATAKKTGNLTLGIMNDKLTNPNTGKTFTKYTADSYTNFRDLLRGRFGTDNKKYLVNAEDDELLNGELTLSNMYFDVHTTVYIIVGVAADSELTVHSLGYPPNYIIEPIIEPTDEFINYNQSADADEKYDYLYYVLKVTYDRNPENPLAAYEVHQTRYSSIANDVLSGNYTSFYKNHFTIYDNYDNPINYTSTSLDNAFGCGVILNSYLSTLRNQGLISSTIYNKYRNVKFDNVSEGIEQICRELKNPGLIYPAYVIATNGDVDEDGNPIKLSSADDIFAAVRNIKVEDEDDPSKLVNYFKSPRLIKRGSTNIVNLSSIPIYTYTVQAVTVDGYSYDESGKLIYTTPEEPKEPEEGEEAEDPDDPRLVLNNSKLHNILNSLYVAAGTNNYNYLGYGDLYELAEPYIYVDDKYSENVELHFTDSYINIEYGEDGQDMTLLSDLPIAENSIVLFHGAEEAKEGYAFVGWFEQKYNKKSNVCLYQDEYDCECTPETECECEDHTCEFGEEGWSELTLMSNELTCPYLTLATADTVIVAMYKKVIDVEVTYDYRELNIELPTGNLDSLGKDVKIVTDETTHTTTISGQFYIDAYQSLIVSPVGGYRFDGFDYQVSSQGEWSSLYTALADDKHILYQNSSGEDVDHYDISLNSVMLVQLAASECLVECSENHNAYEKLKIVLRAKKVVLVNIEVENFTTYNNGTHTFSGWNFGLYDISLTNPSPVLIGRTINTAADTSEVVLDYQKNLRDGKDGSKESHYYQVKDSAGNLLQGKINNGTLVLYGYFDVEMSGNLLLVSMEGDTIIRKWYINGHINTTDSYSNVSSYGIPEQRKAFAAQFSSVFNVNFYYETGIDNGQGSTTDYNTNNYFALDKDNSVYYARAVIEASSEVTIKHTFIDSAFSFESFKVGMTAGEDEFSTANLYSILAYNGSFSYVDNQGNEVTENNGTFVVRNSGTYKFSENTKLNLTVQSKYIVVNGQLYVFLGWFESYGEAGDYSSYLISTELSLQGYEATGCYEAKYVRAHKVELDYNDYGQIEVDPYNMLYLNDKQTEVFAYYETEGYYYIISGADLYVKAYATEGYVLPDFVVTPLEEVQGEISSTTEDTLDYLKLTVHQVDRAIRVSASFDEGYNITINQLLYNSVDMAQDADYIDTVYSYITYREREVKTLTYTVPKNSEVKFSVKGENYEVSEFPEYFFMGWYINGVLVSKDVSSGAILYDYTHTLTKDLVIEARFVPYVNVKINSRVVGTSGTRVYNFGYTLTYTDLRTNELVVKNQSYSATFPTYSLPAGLVVNLVANDDNVSDAYQFVAWRQLLGVSILKTYSTEKDANITLSPELKQDDYIYIYAHFGSVSTLNLYKNITIREEDKAQYLVNGELGDEFLSLFDMVVTYIDINNNEQTVRLGANTELTVVMAKNSSYTIKYELSSVVSDRYYLEKLQVIGSNGFDNTYTHNTLPQTINAVAITYDLTATFLPSSALTITTELNGHQEAIFSSEHDIEYNFNDGAIRGYVDGGSATIKVPAASTYSIIAADPTVAGFENEVFYTFVGWFNGGTLITTAYELNTLNGSGKISINSNLTLTARYVAVVNEVTINRVFEGSTPSIANQNNLDVSLIGNFYKVNENTNIGEINLQTLEIVDGETTASSVNLVANQKIVVMATHLAGYDFVGFEVEGSINGSKSYVTNSFNTVMTMTLNPSESLVINAVYKEKTYAVNYVITSYNSTSNEGGTLSNYTSFYGPSDSTINFTISSSSFIAFVNGIETYVASSGSTHAIIIPTAAHGSDLTVELRFFATETYKSIYAGSGKSWFVADAHEELYAISHKSTLSILSSDYSKLNLVAKEDPYAGYSFDTTYRIDYYDGYTLVEESSVTTTKPTETLMTYGGNTYVFDGYYARVGTQSSYTYIKVGSTIDAAVQGVWANLVAKYRRVETVTITPSTRAASNTVTYVRTPFAIDRRYVETEFTGSVNYTYFSFVSGSSFNGNIIEKTASVGTAEYDTYYVPTSTSYSYYSQIDSVDLSYNIYRRNVTTTINMSGTKISSVSCATSVNMRTATATTSSTAAGDTITINPANTEVDVTFSVNVQGAEEVDKLSTLNVNIYSTDGTYYEPLAVTKNTGSITIKVKTGSTITLSYTNGDHKQFLYYVVNGIYNSNITYSYKISDGYSSSIDITAYFSGKYTASIEENDETKGVATVPSAGSNSSSYTLTISAKSGYMVSAIYFATVESGYDGTYDYTPLYLNSLDLSYIKTQLTSITNMITNGSYTLTLSDADDDARSYVAGMTFSFTAVDNVVIKIEYMHVSKLTIEVRETNTKQAEYFFYMSEFADPEVKVADELTLAKLKQRIDNISAASVKEDLAYTPEELCSFVFEGNIFDDTISINHSARDNVLITLNRVTKAQVMVIVKLNYATEADGSNTYNAPQDGVQVSYDNSVVAKALGGATSFEYITSKSKPLIAEDTKGYFKFDGYYNGLDKERDLLISNSSDYVLLSKDFAGDRLYKVGDVYLIYAIFTESLLNITIAADYTDSRFAISQTDTEAGYKEITTTKQVLEFTNASGENIGNLTYFYNEETSLYELTYPASLVKANAQLYIKAIDFDQIVTDDVYLSQVLSSQGITTFYEKTIEATNGNSINNEYYRFHCFKDKGGLMLGNLYTNFAAISLGDYETGTDITASAKELYMIEFTYNYLPELFYIDLSMIVLQGSNIATITIATTQGQTYTAFEDAILSYKAEKDMNMSVATHFSPGYDYADNADFESILFSNSVMLSDMIGSLELGVGSTPGSPKKSDGTDKIEAAKAWWISKLNSPSSNFIPVSNYYMVDNAEYSKYESFNFIASKNQSFLADFYNIAENVKYYIFSIMTPFDFDGYDVKDFIVTTATSAPKQGNGYYFTLVPEDSKYSIDVYSPSSKDINNRDLTNYFQDLYKETASLKGEQDATLEYMEPTSKISADPRYYTYKKYKNLETEEITTSIDVELEQYSQTSLHVLISNVAFLNYSSMRLIKNYQQEGILYGTTGMDEEERLNSTSYQVASNLTKYLSYNDYIVKNEIEPSAYSGIEYQVRAKMIDGYFFKGFIMYSSGYDATYDLMGFGGENVHSTGKTFTYLPYTLLVDNTTGEYTYAVTKDTFTLEKTTKIYALYEARVYIINLNTYQFNENNESFYTETKDEDGNTIIDNEKSMMTTIDVESAIVKGALIAEHGEDVKLTSISLMFMQFVGWSTSKEYTSEDKKFNVAFDTGEGLDKADYQTYVDKEYITTLKYNDVYVGGFDDKDGNYVKYVSGYDAETEEFAVSNSRNNIYIYNLQSDIDINAYYTYVSYKIKINLADIVPTYVYKDNAVSGGVSTYLTYADYIRYSATYGGTKWKNPSAGTYSYSYNWGTNYDNGLDDNNSGRFTNTITISDNDPYVYTMYDSNGKYIGYPTKVAMSLISEEMSGGIDNGQISGNIVYAGTSKPVYIAKASNKTGQTALSFSKEENEENMVKYHFGVGKDDENFSTYLNRIAKNGLYYRGLSYNDPEYVTDSSGEYITENGRLVPKLNNVYNYLDATFVNNALVYSIKDGLFTIEIDGNKVPASQYKDLYVDASKGTASFEIKVQTNEYGMPGVTLKMNRDLSKYGIYGMTPHSIYVTKTSDETIDLGVVTGTNIKGFNSEAFCGSDFITDPDYEVPDLDVELVLRWQEKADAIETRVTLQSNNSEVYLSGNKANSSEQLHLLECISKNQCRNAQTEKYSAVCNGYEIAAYFIVIIENGQYILDLLNERYNSDPLARYYYTAITEEITATTSDLGAVKNVSNMYQGNLLTYDERETIIALLNSYHNGKYINLKPSDILKYRVIDVFEYYKNGINFNFYTSTMNTNDLVLNQPLLQEHSRPQYNNWPSDDFILSGDKGFNYYRQSTAGYHTGVSTSLIEFRSYENTLSDVSSAENDIGFGQSFKNYFAGIYNGRRKFSATYNRLLHTVLVVDESYESQRSSFIATLSINNTSKKPTKDTTTIIMSGLHDWAFIPIGNALYSIGKIAAVGIAVVASGGSALLAIGAVACFVVVGNAIVKSYNDDATIFEVFSNENRWFLDK